MKKTIITILITLTLAAPTVTIAQTLTDQERALKLQLIQILVQQVERLQELLQQRLQTDNTSTVTTAKNTFTNDDVLSITRQTVHSDEREVYRRHEIKLRSGATLSAAYPENASTEEQTRAFRSIGYQGDDIDDLLDQAVFKKPIPRAEKCELESNRRTYEPNELITLTWETSEAYAAFNAYGSSNKTEYVDEQLRGASGSVTLRVREEGDHYINLNVYPTRERFASGTCTALFTISDDSDSDEESSNYDAPQPVLIKYEAESLTVSPGESVQLSYRVETARNCRITVTEPGGYSKIAMDGLSKQLSVGTPLPTSAVSGDKIDYTLSCDSQPTSHTSSERNALSETITINVR